MKKNFFKVLLLGVFTLSLGAGFVGCKDYDDDISRIDERIAALQTELNAAKAQADKGVADAAAAKAAADAAQNTANQAKALAEQVSAEAVQAMIDAAIADLPAVKTDEQLTAFINTTVQPIVDAMNLQIDGLKASDLAIALNQLKFQERVFELFGVDPELYADLTALIADLESGDVTVDEIDWEAMYALVASIESGDLAVLSTIMTNLDLLGWVVVEDPKENVSLGDTHERRTFTVNYAWIEKFQLDKDNSASANSGFSDGPASWSAQITVAKNQVLNTLAAENKGFLVQVYPANSDMTKMELTLENSKNEVLPIKLGKPVLVTGLLTKAATSSALYFIPATFTDAPFAKDKYVPLYKEGAVYSIVEKTTGFRSNYSDWTAVPEKVGSDEIAVDKVGDVEAVYNPTIGRDNYQIQLAKDYDISFVTPSDPKDLVIDYYVEAAVPVDAAEFGFSADKTKGTFRVTKLSDVITKATFDLNVYKLAIDGKIYLEKITIRPVSNVITTTIALGDYLINDNAPTTPEFESQPMIINLDQMFTDLGDAAATWKATGSNRRAFKYELVEFKADTKDMRGGKLANTADIKGLDASGKVTPNLWDTRSIRIIPMFSTNGTDTTFVNIGNQYKVTVNIYNVDGDQLNTLTVTFTPKIPALTDLIVKDPAFWNTEMTILNAYYKDPVRPWKQELLTPTYSIALGTAGNGGFTKMGNEPGKDKQWATIAWKLDTDQKIAGTVISGNYVAYSDATRLFSMQENPTATPALTYANNPAYAYPLNVQTSSALYLGVYAYTGDALKAPFQIKMMSALEQGTIRINEGNSIVMPAAAAGAVRKLTADYITGYSYNNQPYSLFKEWIVEPGNAAFTRPAYKWTYVSEVTFSVPAGQENIYSIGKTVLPTADSTDSYVELKPGNISQTTNTSITVTVKDRFHQSKTVTLPLTITVGE